MERSSPDASAEVGLLSRAVLVVAVAFFSLTAVAAPPETSVKSTPIQAGRLVTVTVPGTLLDVADACTAERCHGLLLLAKAADRRTVFYFNLRDSTPPEALAAELPQRADALAVHDLDGDGTMDLLAGEPGRLYRIGTLGEGLELGEARLVVESRYLDLAALVRGGFLEPGRIAVPGLTDLELHATSGDAAVAPEQLKLPYRARRERTGLRLYTYPVTRLAIDGRTLYAVGPEPHGNRRLRTVLIEPDAGGEMESEAWSWLPAPETVVGSWYASANGRPALVVTTVRADRIGVFEKKKLRVFALTSGDRSRAGSRPSLAADTACHHWQDADPTFADADGDSLVDLVVVQPQGMGGKKLVVEAYLGRRQAQFHTLPLRSVVPAKRADAWYYGGDVDGDGVADLVTRSGELLQVFRGVFDPKKKQVLDKDPLWRIELESGAPVPDEEEDDEEGWEGRNDHGLVTVRDVDRDGRAEILVHSESGRTSLLRIVDPE